MPLTARVRQLIDTAEFRRLARISQLGLVSLVYPAAIHTRFEHSPGRVSAGAAVSASSWPTTSGSPRPSGRKTPRCSSPPRLLHDLGHWPFCHPIEDIRLPSVPSHELFANSFLLEGEIADVLRHDWGINPARRGRPAEREAPRPRPRKILASMLSGPIDIDKMDYLFRDSLHAGVPYGRHFDQQRLLRQPVPERGGRRPGDHRQGQDGRRTDGLRPLRHVQRGLLAPRRPRGHGHAAAGVLPAARRARSRRACSA